MRELLAAIAFPGPDRWSRWPPGIDFDDVTDTLLRQGIDAFATPMEKLLAGIEAKREAILTGRPATASRR